MPSTKVEFPRGYFWQRKHVDGWNRWEWIWFLFYTAAAVFYLLMPIRSFLDLGLTIVWCLFVPLRYWMNNIDATHRRLRRENAHLAELLAIEARFEAGKPLFSRKDPE